MTYTKKAGRDPMERAAAYLRGLNHADLGSAVAVSRLAARYALELAVSDWHQCRVRVQGTDLEMICDSCVESVESYMRIYHKIVQAAHDE